MDTVHAGQRIPMSWDDYTGLPDHPKGEYIDGAFQVSPSPEERHRKLAGRLADMIEIDLPRGMRVRRTCAWKPGSDEFVPDLMVLDAGAGNGRYTGTPHLVVEILPTDATRDHIRKATRYATAGAPRYWVVDPDGPEIIEHTLDPDTPVYTVTDTHRGDGESTLDIGVAKVTLTPDDLTG